MIQATLDHTVQESDTIWTFYFQPEKPLRYTAGQFISVYIPHDNPDNRGTTRSFTLSSSPSQKLLSITTRYAGDDHTSSFKKTLFAMQPGEQLGVSDPIGDFVLPRDPTIPLIFIAGGIGITPIHSILQWLVDSHEQRNSRLLYGVTTEGDILFQDTMKKAGVPATIVVSQPSAAWGGERGHLSAKLILSLEKPAANTMFYLSGPEAMVFAMSQELRQSGIEKQQLVLDQFSGYENTSY